MTDQDDRGRQARTGGEGQGLDGGEASQCHAEPATGGGERPTRWRKECQAGRPQAIGGERQGWNCFSANLLSKNLGVREGFVGIPPLVPYPRGTP